jgi:hypothetical protein
MKAAPRSWVYISGADPEAQEPAGDRLQVSLPRGNRHFVMAALAL